MDKIGMKELFFLIGSLFVLISLGGKRLKINFIDIEGIGPFPRIISFIFGIILIFSGTQEHIAGFLKNNGLITNSPQVVVGDSKKQNVNVEEKKVVPKPEEQEKAENTQRNETETQKLKNIKVEVPQLKNPVEIPRPEPGLGLASIKSPDKFVVCRRVENRNPKNIADSFTYGKVYAWAQIHSPQAETVTLKWFGPNKNPISVKAITIGANIGDGYRIYDWKEFHPTQEGVYELKLYNSASELIGTRRFQIVGNYADNR